VLENAKTTHCYSGHYYCYGDDGGDDDEDEDEGDGYNAHEAEEEEVLLPESQG